MSALQHPIVEMAAEVGRLLAERRLRLVTAESCTGGLVAAAITEVPGSSGWFERGYVTYSNRAKTEELGVSEDLLRRHGAVSEPTAHAMAAGALARSGAELAIAVTGIAGPGGAVPGKPVGTVCIGLADASGAAHVQTHHFGGDRQAVRLATTAEVLKGIIAWLAHHPGRP